MHILGKRVKNPKTQNTKKHKKTTGLVFFLKKPGFFKTLPGVDVLVDGGVLELGHHVQVF
jgi:hypothetical protein